LGFKVYGLQLTLYSLTVQSDFTVYTLQLTVYGLQSTLYSSLFTLYT